MEDNRPGEVPQGEDNDSAKSSRARLLEAAADLVLDHYSSATGLRDAFAYLTPGAVAARAGLSRALIYHHWRGSEDEDSFEQFLADLADWLWSTSFDLSHLVAAGADIPPTVTEMVSALAEIELDRTTSATRSILRATHALTLHSCISAEEAGEVIEMLGEFYDSILGLVGREMVPPLTTQHLAFSIAALLDGFAIQSNVMPERSAERLDWKPRAEDTSREWTLFGVATEGLVLNMTRPVADPEAADDDGVSARRAATSTA